MKSNVTLFSGSNTPSIGTPIDGAVSRATEVGTPRTFHFWNGASTRRYVHIVHSLFECPEIEASNYVLVHVDSYGRRTPLRIARTTSDHGSENLAEIRHHAARLGANEVHLNVLGDTPHAQAVVQWDLAAEHFGSLMEEVSAEANQTTVNA